MPSERCEDLYGAADEREQGEGNEKRRKRRVSWAGMKRYRKESAYLLGFAAFALLLIVPSLKARARSVKGEGAIPGTWPTWVAKSKREQDAQVPTKSELGAL